MVMGILGATARITTRTGRSLGCLRIFYTCKLWAGQSKEVRLAVRMQGGGGILGSIPSELAELEELGSG
jgi:hypothetical protein